MSRIVGFGVPLSTPTEVLKMLEPSISGERFDNGRNWVKNAFVFGDCGKPEKLDYSPLLAGKDEFTACFAEGAVFAAALYTPRFPHAVRAVAANYAPHRSKFVFPKTPRWSQQLLFLGVAVDEANAMTGSCGGQEAIEVRADKLDSGRAFIVVEG